MLSNIFAGLLLDSENHVQKLHLTEHIWGPVQGGGGQLQKELGFSRHKTPNFRRRTRQKFGKI